MELQKTYQSLNESHLICLLIDDYITIFYKKDFVEVLEKFQHYKFIKSIINAIDSLFVNEKLILSLEDKVFLLMITKKIKIPNLNFKIIKYIFIK